MKLSLIKKSLVFVLLITALTQAQFRRRPDFPVHLSQSGIYFESIIVPDDSGAICYLPFRISYNSLVFVKENQKFKAKYTITAEGSDSLGKSILRDIISKEIVVDSYENTLDENFYSEGLLTLNLTHGNYTITPFITDVNASREQPAPKIKVNTSTQGSEIFPPILFRTDTSCDSISNQLVNFEGQVPFSSTKYDLLIPVKDSTVTSIDVEIINNEETIEKITLNEFFWANLELRECRNNIYLTSKNSNFPTRNFVYHNFNENLKEGEFQIKVSYHETSTEDKQVKTRSFDSVVRWFDKPFSLNNISFSIRILKYITDENTIDTLMDKDETKQYEQLVSFWKSMDPTPGTEFNELMKEYYDRVDYAIKNFSSLGSKNGAETDRGKIYIQFGKPDDIRRVYDDPNNIKEIWTYNNSQQHFIFTDKTGLGNFILTSRS